MPLLSFHPFLHCGRKCQNSIDALRNSKTDFPGALSGFSAEAKSTQDYRKILFPNPSQIHLIDFCHIRLFWRNCQKARRDFSYLAKVRNGSIFGGYSTSSHAKITRSVFFAIHRKSPAASFPRAVLNRRAKNTLFAAGPYCITKCVAARQVMRLCRTGKRIVGKQATFPLFPVAKIPNR